jgi:outer membrane protein assembly factor BamE (lipoprotein component of BamABCDE complex)
MDMKRKPWLAAALIALCVTLLSACDQQKVADAVNAIKPDSMAFGDLRVGVSTVDDVRRQAGKPEMVWEDDDGSQRLEYPRGPNGLTTWMLDFDADGKLVAMSQALNAQNIAQVVPGMPQDEVRRLLGKPATVAKYALSHEEVWSWHWAEGGVAGDGMFNAHFSPDGLVIRTSRSDAPGHEQH